MGKLNEIITETLRKTVRSEIVLETKQNLPAVGMADEDHRLFVQYAASVT